jgi:hypothetical protein
MYICTDISAQFALYVPHVRHTCHLKDCLIAITFKSVCFPLGQERHHIAHVLRCQIDTTVQSSGPEQTFQGVKELGQTGLRVLEIKMKYHVHQPVARSPVGPAKKQPQAISLWEGLSPFTSDSVHTWSFRCPGFSRQAKTPRHGSKTTNLRHAWREPSRSIAQTFTRICASKSSFRLCHVPGRQQQPPDRDA